MKHVIAVETIQKGKKLGRQPFADSILSMTSAGQRQGVGIVR